MRTRLACWAVACLVLAGTGPPARAQKQSSPQEVRNLYDVDAIMQQAVENISMRYNLNRSQHELTQEMMKQGVSRFLREHQDEIYPLIRDLTRARFSGQNLTEEQRRRIGKAAKPLVQAAKKAILDANSQWREILSEEQKKLHNWDLHEMDGQFEEIDNRFRQMSEGKAVDNPIFPEPKPKTPEPPRPPKPVEKILPSQGPVVERPEDVAFDVCVQKFIKDYKLDAAQQESARSILREYKLYAQVYRDSHKEELAGAERKANEARNSGDIEKAKEAEAEQERLNARIRQFLEEMRQRLMSIPREAQKKAYEAMQNKDSGTSSDKAKAEPDKAKGADDKKSSPKAKDRAKKPKRPKSKSRRGKSGRK